MKVFQIGTYICFSLVILLSATSQFAMANDSLKMTQPDSAFLGRLRVLYADKNSQFPTGLSVQPTKDLKRLHDLTKDTKAAQKLGGVSDGGGNAVGVTLFDFYENVGSLEVNIDELLRLEPQAERILSFLNETIPAVEKVNGNGLGDILKRLIGSKKIYLEPKEISSEGCINQSMVSSAAQRVVACQSEKELRISINWMKSTDTQNRSGLIMHELVLSWIRSLELNLDKDQKERLVREINREIFKSLSAQSDLITYLNKELPIRFYDKHRLTMALALPSVAVQIYSSFCGDSNLNIDSILGEYKDAFYSFDYPHALKDMMTVSDEIANTKSLNKPSSYRICAAFLNDRTPIHQPRMDLLSKNILSLADRFLEKTQKAYADFKRNSTSLNQYYSFVSDYYFIFGAGVESISEGEQKEALNYVRFMARQSGLELSFTRILFN